MSPVAEFLGDLPLLEEVVDFAKEGPALGAERTNCSLYGCSRHHNRGPEVAAVEARPSLVAHFCNRIRKVGDPRGGSDRQATDQLNRRLITATRFDLEEQQTLSAA